MATVDVGHDCEGGGDAVGGAVAVHEKAASSCCGALLALADGGFTCTQCSQPCDRVLGPPTAHWTCRCGTRRAQVITRPADVPAEG